MLDKRERPIVSGKDAERFIERVWINNKNKSYLQEIWDINNKVIKNHTQMTKLPDKHRASFLADKLEELSHIIIDCVEDDDFKRLNIFTVEALRVVLDLEKIREEVIKEE